MQNTDRNGYLPSIVKTERECYICKRTGDLARHEPLDGIGRRSKSKELGLWVYLCPYHHAMSHNDRQLQDELREDCERAALRQYGWTTQDFINEFGKNYI